jgi:RND family efflux transporter MFP subunit
MRLLAYALAVILHVQIVMASEATPPSPIPCLIEPHQQIKLATPVPGVLQDVLVERGDHVRKGQLLARLESAVEEADVASAEIRARDDSSLREKMARMDFTESKRSRLDRLHASSQYVSPTALEEAAADAKQAQAEVQSAATALRLAQVDLQHARGKLGQRTILSPIDGVVTERPLGPGEYAFDQGHVLTVAEIDPLNIEAFLPISLYGSIKIGEVGEIRPEAPVGGLYRASVVVIDTVLDSRSSTFGVRLRLPNPDSQLPAGIRCTITLSE